MASMSLHLLALPLPRPRSVGVLLLAAASLNSVQAQLPPMQMQGAPSPNSLLNDLRSIQFPPAGGQAAPQGGMGLGGFGLGGGVPPAQPAGIPQQGFGGIPTQGFGGMPPQGGGIPAQGFGMPPQGFGMPPQQGGAMPPQGFGGFAQPGTGMPPPAMPTMGGGGFGMPPPQMGGAMGGGMPQQQQQQVEAPEDMACAAGPHAAAWAAAKQRFRAVTSAPLGMAPREVLVGTLEEVMRELKAANALASDTTNECGPGKLSLQLLSLLTMDDSSALAQLFSSVEQLASPVLTLLLDVPWAATAQAGWPFFGFLAQINLRKRSLGALGTEAIDGLNDPATQVFYHELQGALTRDGTALEAAAQSFLQKEGSSSSALAALTAMSAQAAGTADMPARAQMLGAMQAGMKQVIADAGELDIGLSTQWPLWGLLHVGVDSLAAA